MNHPVYGFIKELEWYSETQDGSKFRFLHFAIDNTTPKNSGETHIIVSVGESSFGEPVAKIAVVDTEIYRREEYHRGYSVHIYWYCVATSSYETTAAFNRFYYKHTINEYDVIETLMNNPTIVEKCADYEQFGGDVETKQLAKSIAEINDRLPPGVRLSWVNTSGRISAEAKKQIRALVKKLE